MPHGLLLGGPGLSAFRSGAAVTMDPARPLVDDALILCRDGRIEHVGSRRELDGLRRCDVRDLGAVCIGPALVNPHTHLNLSHARGRTRAGEGFAAWLRSLLPLLREPLPDDVLAAAVAELAASGTAVAADIVRPDSDRIGAFLARVGIEHFPLLEFLGFRDGDRLDWPAWLGAPGAGASGRMLGVSGHAPYSTAPERLVAARDFARAHGLPYVMHLAESPDEDAMIRHGSGPLRELFEQAGILPPGYTPPGMSPVRYAADLGLLGPGTLAVHCVCVDEDDAAVLAATGTTACLCPRSNRHIGVGDAPVALLRRQGVPLVCGTDGLSSNDDYDLWQELRVVRELSGGTLSCVEALEMAAAGPARALGLGQEYGTLRPGGRAAFAVIPDDVASWR